MNAKQARTTATPTPHAPTWWGTFSAPVTLASEGMGERAMVCSSHCCVCVLSLWLMCLHANANKFIFIYCANSEPLQAVQILVNVKKANCFFDPKAYKRTDIKQMHRQTNRQTDIHMHFPPADSGGGSFNQQLKLFFFPLGPTVHLIISGMLLIPIFTECL